MQEEDVSADFIRAACSALLDAAPDVQLSQLDLVRALLRPGGQINPRHQMIIVRELTATSKSGTRPTGALNDAPDQRNPMLQVVRLHEPDQLKRMVELADAGEQQSVDRRQLVLELLRLLHDSAPNQLVYDSGKAVRRHEEAARLIQACVDWRGIVALLVSVGSFDFKAALLRFVEQIFGSSVANGWMDGASLVVSAADGLTASEIRRDVAKARLTSDERAPGSAGAASAGASSPDAGARGSG